MHVLLIKNLPHDTIQMLNVNFINNVSKLCSKSPPSREKLLLVSFAQVNNCRRLANDF